MNAGESFTIGSYALLSKGLDETDPHFDSATARRSSAHRRPRDHADVAGEALISNVRSQPNVAIRSTPAGDLHVVLAGIDDRGQTATFEVFLTPSVFWLSAGGLLMVLRTVIVVWLLRTVIVMWPNVRERGRNRNRTQQFVRRRPRTRRPRRPRGD